jgi:hypothetical protein
MPIVIFGEFDRDQLYCAGSVTKLLTTFVVLSLLSEKYDLSKVLDDEYFLDTISTTEAAKDFLQIFKNKIGPKFTLRDICSFYAGLPYTFEPDAAALERVDAGESFVHHSIPDEKAFLHACKTRFTPIYPNRSKFHYSEISIMFLGYLFEKIYNKSMEELYQKYLIGKFKLAKSQFARKRPKNVYFQDLSGHYDYAAVAKQDHGFFCYGNGFYTTLNDMKLLLENLLNDAVFQHIVDVKTARSASDTLMNGLTIEMRKVGDDVMFGYDGVSFSGCNVWAYSTKLKTGYLTFCNHTETAYQVISSNFKCTAYDEVPEHTTQFYSEFLKKYAAPVESKGIPVEYQGKYRRVKINGKKLKDVFVLGKDFLVIRDPLEVRYNLTCVNSSFHIQGDDQTHEARVSLHQAKSGNRYLFYNGTLYGHTANKRARKPWTNSQIAVGAGVALLGMFAGYKLLNSKPTAMIRNTI